MSDISTLTEGTLDGTGSFDVLMQSAKAHIDEQYKLNRISGEEYAKLYTQTITVVLQQAIQYELTKAQTDAQVRLIDEQVLNAQVERELLAVQKANATKEGANLEKQGVLLDKQALQSDQQILNLQAEVALNNQRLANLAVEEDNAVKQGLRIDKDIAQAQAQTDNLIVEKDTIIAKTAQITGQTSLANQQRLNLVTDNTNALKQGAVIDQEILLSEAKVDLMGAEITQMTKRNALVDEEILKLKAEVLNIPKEGLLLDKQKERIDEEILASGIQRNYVTAQTTFIGKQSDKIDQEILLSQANITKTNKEIEVLNQRKLSEQAQIHDIVDGVTVTGVLGKQKNLYQAQTDGFERDAEQKLAKIAADVFSITRTTDEATSASIFGLDGASLKPIFDKAKEGIGASGSETPPA